MFRRCLLALPSGLLLAAAFEPLTLWWVMPLSVAGLVLSVHGLPVRRAWLPGWLFGIGFLFVHIFWMRAVGPDAWLALATFLSLWFCLLGATLPLTMRLPGWPVWVAAGWVSVEILRGAWPFGGMPWGRLSFGVVDTPWAAGLPWLGMSGVSLLVALLGTTLAWAVLRLAQDRTKAWLPVLAVLGVAVLGLLPSLRPYDVPDGGERVRVAAVQGGVPGDGTDVLADHRQVTLNHVEATRQLAEEIETGREQRPDFVLWPENSTAVDPFLDDGVNAGIEMASAAVDVPILVGAMVDGVEDDDVLNQGVVWNPDTGPGDRYTKRHPVPFGEYIPYRDKVFQSNFGRLDMIPRDMLSGTRMQPLRIGGVRVADSICFDVAYDDGLHAQLAHGGQLVVVQTSNAMFIHTAQVDQQFAISRLRAVETGKYVVVAAINGVSGVIAPDGTVVERAPRLAQAVMAHDVVLNEALTPAVRFGAWPGRVLVLLWLAVIMISLFAYRGAERRRDVTEESGSSVRAGEGQEAHAS